MRYPSSLAAAFGVCALVVTTLGACSAPDEIEDQRQSKSYLDDLGLNAAQEKWVSYVATNVVPKLAGASLDERAHRAALATWWSLKEGVLDVKATPFDHNLCASGGTQSQQSALSTCAGPWQVGIAAMYMTNVTDAEVTAAANKIYPGVAIETILTNVAAEAGFAKGSSTSNSIAASSGRLRAAWLVRDGAIGVTLNEPFVDDCLSGNAPDWCFGGWEQATRFASSSQRIASVISQLEARFKSGSGSKAPPGSSSKMGSDPCANATLGDGGYCATYFDPKADVKTLLTCANRKTVASVQCASGCQRMADGDDDVCAAAKGVGSDGAGGGGSSSTTRTAMIQRARSWADIHMPYCGGVPGGPDALCGGTCNERLAAPFNKAEWNKYRSDCSGFVSFVWQLNYQDGHRTWGFAPFNQEGEVISKVIAPADLQPGDALNTVTDVKGEQHIMLFVKWADKQNRVAHTIEEAFCPYDIIESPTRQMTFNNNGTVNVSGDDRAFWPIRKSGL